MTVARPSLSNGWSSTLRIRIRLSSILLLILLRGAPALALNPGLDINQYAHTAWTLRSGALKGYPRSLTQTSDGYLWLGTDFGILRFDGVRFVPWQPPAGVRLPSNEIVKLLAGRDGSLWIGTHAGLARWKDMNLTLYSELDVAALLEDRGGVVWVGTSAGLTGTGRLCAIRNGRLECHGSDGTFGRWVLSLYEDTNGSLWAGAASGLWHWKPGAPKVYPVRSSSHPSLPAEIHSLAPGNSATVLIALDREIRQLVGGSFQSYPLPIDLSQFKPTSLLRDRSGELWIGTQDQGLRHVHDGKIDRFTRADGLSGDFVSDVLEDREGAIWVATLSGLDRFRDFAVATISVNQGLSNALVWSVLAARDGSVWLGTVGGLNRWKQGSVTVDHTGTSWPNNEASSLLEDDGGRLWVSSSRGLAYLKDGSATWMKGVPGGNVHAIVEDAGKNLWISNQDRGLLQLSENRVVNVFPWRTFGGKHARVLEPDPVRGGLWLGFFEGGVAHFKDGEVRTSYTPADGLSTGEVTDFHVDRDDRLWVAAQGGLSLVRSSAVTTLSTRNGLPCDAIHWVVEDDMRAFWLGSACGLVRIAASEMEAWAGDSNRMIRFTFYDDSDGVLSHSDVGSFSPKVTKTADGRLWFATYDGVGVIDPKHVPFNSVVPHVVIEQVTADRQAYDVSSSPLHLPANVRDLQIDYTALSLVVPERVRFRYKLEGRDVDWVDAGNRRQAFYTDLSPKAYRFRLVASNNDGVWNEAGAVLDFSIPPQFYQTRAFKVASTVVVALMLWTVYWGRVRRMTARLNVRFEERLAERTRIAQDLHDTLLQGFASMSMQLHVVAGEMEGHALRPRFDRILRRLGEVMDEGRRTVQALRARSAVDNLEEALARDADDFRGQREIDVRVVVKGTRQPLHPLIRDEVYRIGREALANAFSHAHASRIEVDVEYSSSHLRVNVQDNGRGIEPDVLMAGRPGHWGIPGMRERAERLGATIKIRTRAESGTEIELLVPGQLAFQRGTTERERE